MFFKKVILILYTVKYLKPKQIYFRLYFLLRNKIFSQKRFETEEYDCISYLPKLNQGIVSVQSYTATSTFTFLNISHSFGKKIDWNYQKHGKLWAYNLNYFDFLNQLHFSKEVGLQLIHDYIKKSNVLKDGLEPYPISLRGINWIKFISKYNIQDKLIDTYLYFQYKRLSRNLEYHLLGNHLLENGFSLFFGAYYFRNKGQYHKARKILQEELNEQILDDGSHFELSPMYHQILLCRLLDCINLAQNNQYNQWTEQELLEFLKNKASIMLSFLEHITFSNGDIPMVNDSIFDIAPNSIELFRYAKNLGVKSEKLELRQSGYRMIKTGNYECFIDIAKIGPDYIPGHAHSDILNFVLYANEQPFIVDTGVSTYESGDQREIERSTSSHNTVQIGEKEQSEIWASFRVARRAYPKVIQERTDCIEASHTGYDRIHAKHIREFKFDS